MPHVLVGLFLLLGAIIKDFSVVSSLEGLCIKLPEIFVYSISPC